MQQEVIDGPRALEEMLILENSVPEVYLPEPPVEPDEPITLLPPATFGPNELPLTYDNIMSHGIRLIETHAQQHRLDLKVTPFECLQRVFHRNSTPDNLWSFIKICDNPMKVGNIDFLRAFNFSSEASSHPGHAWGENMRQLYVRCFTLSAAQLNDIIDEWENSNYFPEEAKTWADECRNEPDNRLIYIRYVGQCLFPRTARDRFVKDITTTTSTFFTRFAQTLSTLYPEVYAATQVFALREPLSISSEMIDDHERMLICILGYDQLLNRQLGGYYDPIELDDSEINLFKSLQTDICNRWSQQKAPLLEDQRFMLNMDLLDMTRWANRNMSIIYSIRDEYMEKLAKEQTPYLYRNTVLTVLFGDDVTLEAFTQQQDFLCRFSNVLLSRSSAVAINTVTQLLKIDLNESGDVSKEHHFSIFPFRDLYPWVGKRFPIKAREFVQKFLQTIRPLLVIGLGSHCSSTLAANLFHDNGFQSKTFMLFPGIPKICHYAGNEWLKDVQTTEVPERSLFLLIPHLHPGLLKHYSNNRVLHKFNHLCWMVTSVHISLAMTILDENIISPTQNRKEFLNELIHRAAQIMEITGLTDQLESTRTASSRMFEKRSQEQFPRAAPVTELTRKRNSEAALRSLAEAETAIGVPGSAEREQQLIRLWKMNIRSLHGYL
ncbi:hypothetical protein NQZ79_g7576 [Umbelopsis isabellina]|nr:hypothetical protein NQZ79_g7576 [Umbelopsis isabellina]